MQFLLDHPFVFVASEMRTGKSKIVIDAAQFLFEANIIDKVLTLAPAPVRDVWFDPTLGEIAKHLWKDFPAVIYEYHKGVRNWLHAVEGLERGGRRLQWFVTNYEFIGGSKNRLIQLMPFCDHRTLLVLDESSFVKNHASARTKAAGALRRACGRVVLLNGTPISHSPLDLFSQGNLLHPKILDCAFITHFRARYAVMKPVLTLGGKPLLSKKRGRPVEVVEGWRNLDDIQRRFAPYTIRRVQKDCLDLPPKLDPVTLTATLDEATWTVYKQMRDHLVVWLQSGDVSVAATAAIRVMRLAQITSGFLGGIEDSGLPGGDEMWGDDEIGDLDDTRGTSEGAGSLTGDDWRTDDRGSRDSQTGSPSAGPQRDSEVVGREKLDVLLWFLERELERSETPKIVSWCRFRPELFRMMDAVRQTYPQFEMAEIHGMQKKSERLRALSLLKPETSPNRLIFVGGTYGTGSYGLDFTASHISINVSADYSLGKYLQSADRVYGPGQTEPVAYYDIVAKGPAGQKTIDHVVVAARRARQDLANWTASQWVTALKEE